jgi:hypothetical protein
MKKSFSQVGKVKNQKSKVKKQFVNSWLHKSKIKKIIREYNLTPNPSPE